MQTDPSPATPLALIYRIDAGDLISHVNPAWLEFARHNDGEAVMPEKVLGRSLWDCVTDSTVRDIYKRMIVRARDGRPVEFSYRCDAPTKRRVFAMRIHQLPGGEVEFVSTLLKEETRPRVALLAAVQERGEQLLRVCSWCQQVALPDRTWVPVETAVATLQLMEAERLPRITHGICESCAARMLATLSEPAAIPDAAECRRRNGVRRN